MITTLHASSSNVYFHLQSIVPQILSRWLFPLYPCTTCEQKSQMSHVRWATDFVNAYILVSQGHKSNLNRSRASQQTYFQSKKPTVCAVGRCPMQCCFAGQGGESHPHGYNPMRTIVEQCGRLFSSGCTVYEWGHKKIRPREATTAFKKKRVVNWIAAWALRHPSSHVQEWFQLRNCLSYLRYNFRHFNMATLTSWCERDPLLGGMFMTVPAASSIEAILYPIHFRAANDNQQLWPSVW